MANHRSATAAWGSCLALTTLLCGCPTVDLGDTPSDLGLCNPAGGLSYFQDKIWPEYVKHGTSPNACTKAGGCHNEAGGNALGFTTQPIDFAFNYKQTQIYLNCGTPLASALLTKPLAGMDAHGGGDLFTANDPAVTVFADWFK